MGDDRPDKSDRILVFRIGQLGDTVVALPAFWMLRTAFPAASVTLLTNAPAKKAGVVSPRDVLPANGLFDDVITYETGHTKFASVLSHASLARQLRKGKFDRVYYLVPRNRTTAQVSRDERFFRLAGIREVRGAEYHRQKRHREPIPVPTPVVRSEADFLIDLLRSDGITADNVPKDLLNLSSDERRIATEWIRRLSPADDREILVAVAPGSNWPSKTWETTRFASVILQLMSRFAVYPVVFGGERDRRAGDRLVAEWNRGANLAGCLTVRQSAALLERCRLFLGNDTGTMHLAAAVGTPCVAVFAAVDWIGKWLPFGGSRNRILRARVECEGCRLQDCPYSNKCLRLISVDEVVEACVDLLRPLKPEIAFNQK